jgi:hypothetical protein
MVLAGTSMDIRPGSRRSSSNGSSKQEERGKGGRGKRRMRRGSLEMRAEGGCKIRHWK